MRKWRVEDSAELYNINGWGVDYFSINEKGNVTVKPQKDGVTVDLKELLDELILTDVSRVPSPAPAPSSAASAATPHTVPPDTHRATTPHAP